MSTQLDKIDEKLRQLKAKKQAILQREKTEERKRRTRELIQSGALIEKYFGLRNAAEVEALCEIVKSNSHYNEIMQRIQAKAQQKAAATSV